MVPSFADKSFPFNLSHFDRQTKRARLPADRAPKTVSRDGGPRITAGGILIRDGSGQVMRKVPDFEQLLSDMNANKAEIALPELTVFSGAPMSESLTKLLSQPGVLPASTLTPGGERPDALFGKPGPPGMHGMTGAACATGAAGASGVASHPGPPSPDRRPGDDPSSSSNSQAGQFPPGGPTLLRLPSPPDPNAAMQ